MRKTVDLMLEHRPELLSLDVAYRGRSEIAFARRGKVVHLVLGSGRLHGWGGNAYIPLDITPRLVGADIVVPHLPYIVGPDGTVSWRGMVAPRPLGVGVIERQRYRRVSPVGRVPVLHGDRLMRHVRGHMEYFTRLEADGFSEHLALQEVPAMDGDFLAVEYLGGDLGQPVATDAAGHAIALEAYENRGRTLLAVPLPWLAAARYPVDVDPDFTSCIMCWVQGVAPGYVAAWNTGSNVGAAFSHIRMGQFFSGIFPFAVYGVARHSLRFPASCFTGTITSVTMDLAVFSLAETLTDFDVHICQSDWSAQAFLPNSCGLGCFPCAIIYQICRDAVVDVTWRNTAGIVVDTYYTSPAMDLVYPQGRLDNTGHFWYCVRSAEDTAASPPVGLEAVDLYACSGGAFKPLLHIGGDLYCAEPQTHIMPYGA